SDFAVAVGGQALRDGTAVLSPGPVLLAVALGLGFRALAAARWLVVARALGAPLGPLQAWAEYLRSELLNQVLPGAVLGDVDRARRHGKDVGLLPAARAVALERVVGHAVLVLAVVVVLLRRPDLLGAADGADGRTVAVLVVAGAVAVLVGVLLWQPWRRTGGARGLPPALVPALLAAAGLSVGVLACAVTLFVVAARATGTVAPLGDVVPAVLVVLVLAGVPLTVAGWGAREAGAALCFAAVGLPAAAGVSAAVGFGLLSAVAALPGLVPLLLPRLPSPAGTQPAGAAAIT
ncbi:lysylphosphatidylglycerol synthase domain-containing protein, partial [Aquipuribacter hungaricus]|uniref:lysylphosphatidylglycerol synthase domain-containing protein n=1 Tax=Aquipuribacter hungaricus TaxID=545624 RepID=UPI0030ED90FA